MSSPKNFSLKDLSFSMVASRKGIRNVPSKEETDNLRILCNTILTPIWKEIGPIKILSGYRSSSLNDIVGGSPDSQHIVGQAADWIPTREYKLRQLFEWIVSGSIVIPYDKVIFEFEEWIHISWSENPKRQAFITRKEGSKTKYFPFKVK